MLHPVAQVCAVLQSQTDHPDLEADRTSDVEILEEISVIGAAVTNCRSSSYRMEPAGIEPATSGLQSQRSPN